MTSQNTAKEIDTLKQWLKFWEGEWHLIRVTHWMSDITKYCKGNRHIETVTKILRRRVTSYKSDTLNEWHHKRVTKILQRKETHRKSDITTKWQKYFLEDWHIESDIINETKISQWCVTNQKKGHYKKWRRYCSDEWHIKRLTSKEGQKYC